MTKYFQLIDRIVSGLSDRAPEVRRTVYARARTVLVNQLRMDPSTIEDDIARECTELDEAISRVEAKFSDRDIQSQTAELLSTTKIDSSQRLVEPDRPSWSAAQPEITPAAPNTPASSGSAGRTARDNQRAPPFRRFGWSALSAGAILAVLTTGFGLAVWKMRSEPAQALDPFKAQTNADVDVGATSSDGVSIPAPVPLSGSTIAGQAAPLAQRAALLVDTPEEPHGIKVYTGTVIWSLDRSSEKGQALATIVKADIEIPDANLNVAMLMQKNLEPRLPASHTIELHFVFQLGNALGSAKQINMPEMRRDDDTPTGEPLAGVPVSVAENYFLIGLARNGEDVRNMRLITERNWFDVPVLLQPTKRAKLTFEKGPAGQRVWKDALDAWR